MEYARKIFKEREDLKRREHEEALKRIKKARESEPRSYSSPELMLEGLFE